MMLFYQILIQFTFFTIIIKSSETNNITTTTTTGSECNNEMNNNKWGEFNITVYETINSYGKNVTITNNIIEYDDDLFNIIVENKTLKHLCENQINILNELTILQFQSCSIVYLQSGCFNIIPTISLLQINYNPLEYINCGVFNNINVKEIDLSHNLIRYIDSNAFRNNTFLQILKLNYNLLKQIDMNWFQNVPLLYHFNIIYNEISELQENVFQYMNNVKPLKLRLSANQIQEIHSNLFNNKYQKINVLRLNGNKLHQLPSQLFNNTKIHILHINTNYLTCLPNEFYNSNVKELAFYENLKFKCECLLKIKQFIEKYHIKVLYPSIICENRTREVNIVFNMNKTYEIPLLLPPV